MSSRQGLLQHKGSPAADSDHDSSPHSSDIESAPLLAADNEKQKSSAPSPSNSSSARPATTTTTTSSRECLLPIVYGLMNLGSVVSIVVVNKLVLYTYGFKFAATLTWLHTIFTAVGMAALGAMEVFPVKRIPVMRTAPIAAAYVASIVLNNMSLQLNTVGFYQISKILITPAVIAIDYVLYRRTITFLVGMSTVVLMAGVALATLADKEVSTNPVGTAVALLCVVVTGLYQVWAGAKQKELDVTAMQLLHQVSPVAVVLLALLIPLLEPVGFTDPGPETVLGYTFTTKATLCIAVSCVLGLLVTLSTFLFIGATSSLTYNVVGHLKTVGIISAGLMFFGDTMPLPKLAGLLLAMGGIVWYTHLKMQPAAKPAAK